MTLKDEVKLSITLANNDNDDSNDEGKLVAATVTK